MKQVHISTFGCQMNDRDSELMAQFLAEHDYQRTECPEDADLILINTCTIRLKAEEKAYSLLGRLKSLKNRRPDLIIGLGGCVAQQEGEKLLERIPYLDLVFGTRWISRLPGLVKTVEKEGRRLSQTQMEPTVAYRPSSSAFRSSPVKAFGHHHAGVQQLLRLLRSSLRSGTGGQSAQPGDSARGANPGSRGGERGPAFRTKCELFRSARGRRPGFRSPVGRFGRGQGSGTYSFYHLPSQGLVAGLGPMFRAAFQIV
ncbi:MAG: hypothetical protein EHM75_12285 [Desulfobacteraceae bacterium]|nr:MAG: hypothetical protein EHM75_12285 [Desulfobacteraceae bacterium]